MKRLLTLIFIALTVASQAQNTGDKTNIIFDAMQKEMVRTMSMSKTAPKIHFAAFKVTDVSELSIISARGGIAQENQINEVFTDVALRVGTQKEDNSFFEAYTYSQNNTQRGAISADGVQAGLWAASDASYKKALDIYSRKQVYKK